MFLKSQFKASTLCASSALLVLGGFMSINLAGCGGGGGGGKGGFGSPTATPAAQNITFRLVRQDMGASNGGTVTLTSTTSPGTILSATANASGVASIASVPPGTYTVKFTVVDSAGANLSTTTSTLTITRASGQTFLLLQDQGSGSTTGFSVSGTIRLNPGTAATPTPTSVPSATGTPTTTGTPTVTGTPTTTGTPTVTGTPTTTGTPTQTAGPTATPNPFQFSNCTASSLFVTDSLLVEAIDLDTSKGRPIIAQLRRSRSDSNRGAYTILLPYRPAAFQIRISQFDVSGARYAGFSAFSNFNGLTAVTGLNVCVNNNGIAPLIPPTVAFTPTPTFRPFPFGTSTPTPGATAAG